MTLPSLYVLLVIYVILLWINFFDKAPSWNSVKVDRESGESDDRVGCVTDGDCPGSNEKCLRAGDDDRYHCVRKPPWECNPNTGDWVVVANGKELSLRCVCRYPHLVTQMAEGTDCDVDVACGIHGHLQDVIRDPLLDGTCVCDPGYAADREDETGPFCKRKRELDRDPCHPFPVLDETCDCGPDFVSSDSPEAREIFDANYLGQFRRGRRCLRKPCKMNAMNGQTLVHGDLISVDTGFACICDPRYGNFGVHLDVRDYLRNRDPSHYNACASIFDREPAEPTVDAKLYGYFYIEDRPPVCFIKFSNLTSTAEFFGQNETITLSETWPDNYFQYILKNLPIVVDTKHCEETFLVYYCEESHHVKDLRPNCHELRLNEISSLHPKVVFYNKMYRNPICFYADDAIPLYKNQMILNPMSVELTDYPELMRSDGLEISPRSDGRSWFVTWASSNFHKVKHSNYPKLDHTRTKKPEMPYSHFYY